MTEMKLATGNKVPDISLQDRSGKEIRLHSLAGSQVIIYFWASWDQRSRQFNRQLKSLVEQKRNNKPVVYAIGFESYKELWTDVIKKDGIESWINVSDLLNINSGAKTLFNVPDQFPYYILLDKDLTIRYKGNNIKEMSGLLTN
jgi:thiol-disulfide isomerase/thioredoxin